MGISEFAYFSDWHRSGKYTSKIKPILMMIMIRACHACRLTAGKFASVDLPTFLTVCIAYFLG